MATILNKAVCDLEQAKFLLDEDSCVAVRTNVKGEIKTTGLTTAGAITVVTLSDASWTKLPATNLTDRNAISIQNQSLFEMKIRYDSSGGYIGVIIPAGGERYYDITDDIDIYGRLESGGSGDAVVEELS